MKQIAFRWIPGLMLSFVITVGASAEGGFALARYQALLAEGKDVIAAMVETLKEFGGDPAQVSEVVTRAAEDSGQDKLAQVAVAAVGAVIGIGQIDSICSAMGPILDMTPSKEEATEIAAKVLNSITGTGEKAEEERQAVIACALAHGIDPKELLEEAEALGGGGAGLPDSGEGGGGPASPS